MVLPPSVNVIGISGKAETGKDHFFTTVLRPRQFVMLPFAAHMKITLVGRGQATYEEVFVTKPPHVRDLMQEEGTENGWKKYGAQLWIETTCAWIRMLHEMSGLTKFAIPDVRFPHELYALQKVGAKVLRIHAPERAANSRLTPEQRQHESETALDDTPLGAFDGVLFNDPQDNLSLNAQYESLRLVWDQQSFEGFL